MERTRLDEVLKYINASIVVYRIDTQSQIYLEYFNDRFAEIYGGDREFLQAQLQRDLTFGVQEQDKKKVLELFFHVVETKKTGEVTYLAKMQGTGEIWVNMKATAVEEGEDTLVYITFFDVTSQMEAAANARRNEKYLQNTCEFANIFTWIYEIDTKVIHPGTLLQEQIGLPADMEDFPECIFKRNMVCSEYENLYRDKMRELDAGKQQVQFEVQAKLPDGKKHWLSYRFDIVEYDNGQPKISVGSAQFIDERKRLEARYLHEQRRKVVEDPTMFSYVVSNINENKILEQRILQDKMQYGDATDEYELVAAAFAGTIVSKEQRERWIRIHKRSNLLEMLNDGITAKEEEWNILCKDGIMRWVREVMNLVQHPETGEVLLYNYFYNNHDEKIFEELMSAMANYGYEICGSLVADLDQLSVIYAGQSREEQAQLTIGSYTAMNHHYAQSVIEEDLARYLETTSIDYILKKTQNADGGYEITHRTLENGQIRYKKDQCYLYDRKKNTYLILRSDVTEIAEKEAGKRKQLEEALEEARRANQAKSSFLSRMSHELRTPLNAIDGYTALMKGNIESEKPDKELLLKNIMITQRATAYLLTLISDILDIQSIEQGKIKLRRYEVDAESYMKNVVDMIQHEAEEKKIHFHYERKTFFSNAYRMDGARFQQILLNILHNAVKFTPEGGSVTMTAEAENFEERRAKLRFVIRDTGIGMSEEFVQNQLFQKFAQENQEITSPYDGCGTGLFLSKELIALMGGEITCKSQKGIGTEFVVTLEARPVRAAERRKKRPKVSYHLPGLHILLCEDNKMNQDMEKNILERMNCVVDLADDGRIGVEKFAKSEAHQYDAILMDIRMPNVDGLEATKQIRALDREEAGEIPIFAVSANAFEEDVRKSLEAGMNEHIAKPIHPAQIYQILQKYTKASTTK